jgi:molybdopterin converting factor small subunit
LSVVAPWPEDFFIEVVAPAAMKVEVALYATLSKYLPPGAQNRKAGIEVKDGATVREVMNQLGIPPELPNILLVNGRQAPDTTVLKDGETLSIFPPLAGGCPPAWPPLAGGCPPAWPPLAGGSALAGAPLTLNRSAPRPLICPV